MKDQPLKQKKAKKYLREKVGGQVACTNTDYLLLRFLLQTFLGCRNSCNLKEGEECILTCYYDDEITMKLARAVSHQIKKIDSTFSRIPKLMLRREFKSLDYSKTYGKLSLDAVWEIFGEYFVKFVIQTGWDELLQALAYDLKGFLNSLNTVHHFVDRMTFSMKLREPLFRCESNNDGSLLLHYYSSRAGFPGIVKGIVREVSKKVFGIEVEIIIKSRFREHLNSIIKEHIIFSITGKDEDKDRLSCENRSLIKTESNESCGLSLSEFATIFPYHICFSKEFQILHHGVLIKKYAPSVRCGVTLLTDIAHFIYPTVPFIYESLLAFLNSIFVLTLTDSIDNETGSQPIVLKDLNISSMLGSMTLLSNGHFIYMCSLDVSEITHLNQRKLYINDMPLHDATREKLEKVKNNLKKLNEKVIAEKCRSEKLLFELIPPVVAETLRRGQTIQTHEYAEATVLFSDIVTYTNICAACTPYDVFNMLNNLYTKFDRIAKINDVYKVETIGDAYVVASGVPTQCFDHSERILNMAIGMQMEVKSVMRPGTEIPLELRIGIHTGPVFAGVVGIKMPQYCLVGKTVLIARTLEANGVPQRIHVSETTKKHVFLKFPFIYYTWIEVWPYKRINSSNSSMEELSNISKKTFIP
ncbi:adenylate/guanylate cyclase catalytic domain protein [Onchocerca flexuosa]|uniref:guanylate cyclase n=1 Tax=Onchocerca flexuosa TaxID=387005 RepID=A0A238C1Q5_9BILA|nr:adenylate/guanylate cyclase catalytic domain protein [Onchocerca flexuosa]